jgi:hypothetical protein
MHTILCALAGLVKGEGRKGGFLSAKLMDGFLLSGNSSGETRMTYKKVMDHEQTEMCTPRIQEACLTGVEQTGLF